MWRVIADSEAACGQRRVAVCRTPAGVWVGYAGGACFVAAAQVGDDAAAPSHGLQPGTVLALGAPMAGRVVQLALPCGQACVAEATLVVMEAMKMEYRVRAPAAGHIAVLHCDVGDQLELQAPLLTFHVTSERAGDSGDAKGQ